MSNKQESVGRKFDGGKSPIARGVLFYFPLALQGVGECSRYGKEKYNTDYSERNFLEVEGGVGRYTDAMVRHLIGEQTSPGGIDAESGIMEAKMVAWNALARLELLLMEQTKATLQGNGEDSLEEQCFGIEV